MKEKTYPEMRKRNGLTQRKPTISKATPTINVTSEKISETAVGKNRRNERNRFSAGPCPWKFITLLQDCISIQQFSTVEQGPSAKSIGSRSGRESAKAMKPQADQPQA